MRRRRRSSSPQSWVLAQLGIYFLMLARTSILVLACLKHLLLPESETVPYGSSQGVYDDLHCEIASRPAPALIEDLDCLGSLDAAPMGNASQTFCGTYS